MNLTERKIRDARPGSKTTIIWDGRVKGLGLRVTPKGAKAFVIDYRANGRQRRATIGRVGQISLVEARNRAATMLDTTRLKGIDPLQARRERREAITVTQALDRYFNEHVPHRLAIGKMSASTVENYRRWTKPIHKAIGCLKVTEVEQDDIERAVAGLSQVTRNRVLSVTRAAFGVFERWGIRDRNTNPAKYVERATEQPRDRTLSATEMAALARALDALKDTHPAPVAAIQVAARSGLRIGEVLAIRWEDLDLESGALVIPESKTGARVHTLPQTAIAVIKNMPRLNSYVFTNGRRDLPTRYLTCRGVFANAVKLAGLRDVRLHDLRRTAMTLAAADGVSVAVIRDLLGHRTNAAAWRYVRNTGKAVVEAREKLGDKVDEMMAV